MTILDVDEAILESLCSHVSPAATLASYGVTDELDREFAGRFGLVVADPPWGRDLLRLFLVRAAQLARKGGMVGISFPQLLTRPGLGVEINNLLSLAWRVGLVPCSTIANATEYSVSQFERAAYRGCGIDLSPPWRRGDLFLFRKTNAGTRFPFAALAGSAVVWTQFRFGKQRAFVRQIGTANGSVPRILSVPGTAGFLCPTASSRNEMMRRASLVTTQNEAAAIEGHGQLARILERFLSEIGEGHSSQNTRAERLIPAIQSLLTRDLELDGRGTV